MGVNILIGTSNPSKINFFENLLRGSGCALLTPKDLNITETPEETGRTPLENAIQKAEFYGRFADCVFTTDSGMRFPDLPEDDPRQPGLRLRSPYGKRLNDEEMLAYYAGLVRGLGGSVRAWYQDAFALKIKQSVYEFQARPEELRPTMFTMKAQPVAVRREGWPLDSICYDSSGRSFLDRDPNDGAQQHWGYLPRLKAFAWSALGLLNP